MKRLGGVGEESCAMNEAKEIERLAGEVHICLTNLIRQKAIDKRDAGFLLKCNDLLACLARRLLKERNLDKASLEQPIASLEQQITSYEGMDRAVDHYQEEVRRLERELEEARNRALEEAARICDDIRITAPTGANRIRALKSKQ